MTIWYDGHTFPVLSSAQQNGLAHAGVGTEDAAVSMYLHNDEDAEQSGDDSDGSSLRSVDSMGATTFLPSSQQSFAKSKRCIVARPVSLSRSDSDRDGCDICKRLRSSPCKTQR